MEAQKNKNETIEEWIVRFLSEHHMTITTVESCTGGMIASTIVNVSGASSVIREGYVTYSNEAKKKMVGVNPKTIEQYDVVSNEVAKELAMGGCRVSGADVAVSVTGLAGPGGGTEEIPVGTVCIGVCIQSAYLKKQVCARTFHFTGDRLRIRTEACETALRFVREILEEG